MSTQEHIQEGTTDVFCMILRKMTIISVSSIIPLISVTEMECFLRSRKLTFEYSDQLYRQIFQDILPTTHIYESHYTKYHCVLESDGL
jgi:hypothetical protein